jgi:hypothetical protein
MTTMAYDFGNEIHILELDEFDAAVEGSPLDLLGVLPSGRNETLEAAGYRIIGHWDMQGEVEGVEVAARG